MTGMLDTLIRWLNPPTPAPDPELVAREKAAEAEYALCLRDTQRKRLTFDRRPNARATLAPTGDTAADLEAQRLAMRKALGRG